MIKKNKNLKNDDAKKLYNKITKKHVLKFQLYFKKLSKKNIHFENKKIKKEIFGEKGHF